MAAWIDVRCVSELFVFLLVLTSQVFLSLSVSQIEKGAGTLRSLAAFPGFSSFCRMNATFPKF